MTASSNAVIEARPTGKVLTVQGPIEPANVGVTTTHEHLFIDFTPVLTPPVPATEMGLMHEEVSLENLGWIRYHWTSNIDNLQLLDEDLAILEAGYYYNAGGGTVVDATSNGLRRDARALLRVFQGDRPECRHGRGLLRGHDASRLVQ